MATEREHIEEIRRERFWIGVGKNPLSKTLRMAVKYLSAELYSKDVHFLMELIQNAEDNEYPEGVEPSLEFMISYRDITATGAPATLLIFNNEKGFSRRNMESICNVGDSSKAGNRKRGYIGEKGIGFKSVFLLTAQPYIFSNGYQIRFSDTPCPECDIAYIVPEWVDNSPSLSVIEQIYGQTRTLPTTTIILPLKHDKVEAVKEQLSSVHPEMLLFLSKIKRLSVKEDHHDLSLNTIRAISISSERDFVAKKNIDAESYTVHLSAEVDGDGEGECSYYMWKQRFPVREENKVEKRMDMEEWAVTLAFPFGKRLNRGMTTAGIYAFLPTETVTNFPFLIQADFLLPSSRETILWDDIWNQGILGCVPTAFVNAFISLVKTREDAPISSLAPMFSFLPIEKPCHPKLDVIRDSIREKLLQESIIPSESHSSQKFFHKPHEVGRLTPAFWKILLEAKTQGAKLHSLSSHGKQILHSSFDIGKYNNVLNFLGIEFVDSEWYPKCIQSCNLVLGVGDDLYMELLHFLAVNWRSHFGTTTIGSIPLLKYVGASGNALLLSVNEATTTYGPSLCRSQYTKHISWLISWSKEFRNAANLVFLPKKTQECFSGRETVLIWLRDHVKVKTLNVYEYASLLHNSVENDRSLVLAFSHFLYHSFSRGFFSESEIRQLCNEMPLLNSYRGVSVRRKGVLVPAHGSKWVELMGSNPWEDEDYVELAEEYLHSGQYAGEFIPENKLIEFLKRLAGATDIPDIFPPDAAFPSVSGPLTKPNTFLLLDWIRKLRRKGVKIPSRFLSCIKNGSWLKVTMSGCPGYKPPSQSFLPSSSWGILLQNGSDMVDIPLVDQQFYDNKMRYYEEELKEIGVMSECGQACEFIGKHLMSLASDYNLTGTKVLAMLHFIRFLRDKYLPVDEFINSVKTVKWVRTVCGYRSPIESVLYDQDWEAASSISDIPFLDQDYYGKGILEYKTELNLLGVTVGFQENYQIVVDHLRPSTRLNYLMAEPLILALKCIANSSSSRKVIAALIDAKCIKTNSGHLSPGECFLFDDEWGCILKVFEGFPCIDGDFYGTRIFQYKDQLRKIRVVVDFDVAAKAFSNIFKQQASSNSFTKENVLSFLACYRKLKETLQALPADLAACIQEARWLKSRLGDLRSPKDCILFGQDWLLISRITLLPFVGDGDSGYGKSIHEYKDELKSLGVVIDIKEGSEFVLSHILFPQHPRDIAAGSVISLLQCIRNLELEVKTSLPEGFLEKIRQTKWLKTTLGYLSPQECLLFDPKQRSSLQRLDGPFIDKKFYGPSISSYKKELAMIGVIVDMASSDASSLLARHIYSLSDFAMIERIYDFLRESDWKASDEAHRRIWIPTSLGDGMWVSPKECVLHDDYGLFSSRLHILDQKNYKKELLMFFSKAFEVRSQPSTDEYCMLWKEWENSRDVLSHDECCAFWGYVIRHWSKQTEEMLSESVAKIPAVLGGSGDILLLKKQDVFLPDDLLLKDLFEKSSPYALFVWCPKRNLPSAPRSRLLNVYAKIGVRKITKSLNILEVPGLQYGELKQVSPRDVFIGKGLVKLILGFLADPSLNLEVGRRLEIVKALLNVSAFETLKPITISYSIKMTTGDVVKASTSGMVRWERESSQFFTQKLDKSGGLQNVVEYATKFSEVVSKGLLWEKEDQIPRLSELIMSGFLMGFDEDAVAYFMKSRNLQIFAEDEEFLSSVFPSC